MHHRYLVAGCMTVALALFILPGSSSALASPRSPTAPSGEIGCKFKAVAPFFLTTKSRKMYAEGKITECTNPPPDKCKMTVHLRSSTTGGLFWDNRQSKSTDWEACAKIKKRPVQTPPDTCNAYPELVDWDTEVLLSIEISGEPVDSGSDTSETVKYYCAP
jgi:hypothetical protein